MLRRMRSIAAPAVLLTLVACRQPAETAADTPPPPPAAASELPPGRPCEELSRQDCDLTAGAPQSFDLTVAAGECYIVYATPLSDTVAPTLSVTLGDRTQQSAGELANRRYAAVALQPTAAGSATVTVGCADSDAGRLSVRVVKAGRIEPGQQVTGRLADFSDFCFYLAEVSVGNRYEATTVGSALTCDTLLSVRRLPDLCLHTSNDDIDDKTPASTVVWTAPVEATELLCVTAATPRGVDGFTLQVKLLPTPVG